MSKVYLWYINHPGFEYAGVVLVLAESREKAKEIAYKEVIESYGEHRYFDEAFSEEDPDDIMSLEENEPFIFVAN